MGICDLAVAIYEEKNPKNYIEQELKNIDPKLAEEAMKYTEYGVIEEDDDDIPELTPELIEVIDKIEEAGNKGFLQSMNADREIKVQRYSLYELYIKLIEDMKMPGTCCCWLMNAVQVEELFAILCANFPSRWKSLFRQ